MSPRARIDELRFLLADRPCGVVIVAGAGVSIGASGDAPAASWPGLLREGIERCRTLGSMDRAEASELTRILDGDPDTPEYLAVAGRIVERLGGADAPAFRGWLADTVGRLSPERPRTIEALDALRVPIATTNYDEMITSVTRRRPVTCREPDRAMACLEAERGDVLHLHGHWSRSETVVLDFSAYDEVMSAPGVGRLLSTIWRGRTLVFVGFGDGLADPTFGRLRAWSRRDRARSGGEPRRHYRLVLEEELPRFEREHADDPIEPVPFGRNLDDLPDFLRELGTC